ncbi:hypothetical protein A7X12_24620 [Sphingomonas sp. TDK1]|nr:hypothetical protein A7X12_24620 [Sphingomonas sp. TDK1]
MRRPLPLLRRSLVALASIALLAAPIAGTGAAPRDRTQEAREIPESTRLNRIQVLGTHNSYAIGVDPRILELLDTRLPPMSALLAALPAAQRQALMIAHPNVVRFSEALNYRHPSLTHQLDLGVRAVELDVQADPDGGAYADPAAYRLLRSQGATDLLPFDQAALAAPGLKVLHMADIDVRSSCPTFRQCLAELKAWSDAHPRHVPIFVLVEAKVQAPPPLPGASRLPPFTADTYDEIDKTINATIGRDRLVTPDDVRGSHATLEEAVLAGHWPTLGQARGKFVFQLITATGPDGTSAYLRGHEGLKGRLAFLDAKPGQPHAAFLLEDNALARGAAIRSAVAKGYMVRTRADIETYEAKVNDIRRATAAFESGAQVVSTDFEKAGNAYGTPYVVRLPGKAVARVAPLGN